MVRTGFITFKQFAWLATLPDFVSKCNAAEREVLVRMRALGLVQQGWDPLGEPPQDELSPLNAQLRESVPQPLTRYATNRYTGLHCKIRNGTAYPVLGITIISPSTASILGL